MNNFILNSNFYETLENVVVDKVRTCGCCGLIHIAIDKGKLDSRGWIWFDCKCGSTMICKQKKKAS